MTGGLDHKARLHSDLPPSSADKWLNCYAWRRLRAEYVRNYGEPPSSAAADEGTEAHELMQLHISLEKELDEDYENYDELMEVIEWVEKLEGGLHLETRLDYGEALGFVDLTGSGDLVQVEPERLSLIDLKFGRMVVEHEKNDQLMVYLVGAVNKFGPRPNYRIVILQPRAYHPAGPIRSYELDHEELQDFIDNRLTPAIEGSYDPKSKATPGPWCWKFCLVAGSCEALRQQGLQRLRDTPL